jgi:UDP-glucose 4-epimerase
MRILVTGGFGFVGGRLAQHLRSLGHDVVLGTRHHAQRPGWIDGVQVVQTRWQSGSALELACRGADVVVHAAGMNAADCAKNPVAALQFNGVVTARLAASAVRAGVKRIVYLSTAHVYSSPLLGAISEETCPRNLHPYATSHLAGEHAVLQASNDGRLGVVVLRLSNVFGPPVHKDVGCWTLLVNDLCRQAVENRRIVLRSSGASPRDFISMTDACRAIGHLVACDRGEIERQIYNVGSGLSLRVLEMANLVKIRCLHVLGYEPDLKRMNVAVEEASGPLYYTTEIFKHFGIEISHDFGNEIDKTLLFCKKEFGSIRP